LKLVIGKIIETFLVEDPSTQWLARVVNVSKSKFIFYSFPYNPALID